jgi:hypothetical protein
VPLSGEDARSPEIKSAFPFGRLRRPAPSGLEIVEIQLEKRGAHAFRLNFGIAPAGGIEHVAGHVAQEDIWVHYLDRSYAAYQWPAFRRWFSVWHWPGAAVSEADYEKLVDSVVKLIPEVERALRDGELGPHIKRIG